MSFVSPPRAYYNTKTQRSFWNGGYCRVITNQSRYFKDREGRKNINSNPPIAWFLIYKRKKKNVWLSDEEEPLRYQLRCFTTKKIYKY